MSDEIETKIQYLGQPRPRDVTYDAMQKRIAELQLALNAVHQHAMCQSGGRTFDQCSAALGYIDDICRAVLGGERQ